VKRLLSEWIFIHTRQVQELQQLTRRGVQIAFRSEIQNRSQAEERAEEPWPHHTARDIGGGVVVEVAPGEVGRGGGVDEQGLSSLLLSPTLPHHL
jgi:hypothetical protein